MRPFWKLPLMLLIAVFLASCTTAQTASAPTQVVVAPTATEMPTTLPTVQAPDPTEGVVPVSGEPTAAGITYTLIPEKSSANYRVTEQLVRNDLPNDAVGRTSAISGSIVLLADGTVDAASSKFTVDLSTLQSDSGMRDSYVRRNTLQTDQYPEAVFIPKEIKGLSFPVPQSGSVSFQVVGDLTIRDVTRTVTWDVTGEVHNGEAAGTAVTTFTFSDFNLTQPQVPVVLSVDENIILEATVALKLAGG